MPSPLGAPVFPKQRVFSFGFWLRQVLEALLGTIYLVTSSARTEYAPLPVLSCAWGRQESQDRASQPFRLLPAWVGGVLGWEGLFLGSLESAARHPIEETLAFPSCLGNLVGQDELVVGGGKQGLLTHLGVSTSSRPPWGSCSITIFLESTVARKLRLQILV